MQVPPPGTTLSRRINFIDVFSDPSYISRIDINMTADNYCSINLDGNWYLNKFFNITDARGAPQCSSISRTIVDKTYNKDSYITFYATDDGQKTTVLSYSVTFTIKSK